jgi:TM2 domain-containing membrane protein YozV
MNNYTNDNTARRYRAHVSIWGTTQIHLRNPYIIAWWSAAFPGFGHLLLSKYLRGFVLFIWEVVVNIKSKLNLAMVYSFQGDIEKAKEVLDTRWLLIYIPVYIFAIWDSYRTTVDLNQIHVLAEREEHEFNSFSMGALEINYLDKRNPVMAVMWSFFVPGLGQLYIHRIVSAFFTIIWVVIFFYYSHGLEAFSYLFMGDIKKSTAVIHPEWLLFFPSLYGFSLYDSYINTVENNKLFNKEQRAFFRKNYQSSSFQILKGQKVK